MNRIKTHGESIYVWSGVPIKEHNIIDTIGDGVREKRIYGCDVALGEEGDVEFLEVRKKGGVNVVNDTSKASLK